MGQTFIPCVMIWDKVCTVPRHILESFLDWPVGHGVQVICCGDQGQAPPFAGIMLLSWVWKGQTITEVEVNNRAKDDELKDLKRRICLQSVKVQSQEMGKALQRCLGWDRFIEAWKPSNLILTS